MKIKQANVAEHPTLTTIMRQSKAFWGYDEQQLVDWEEELTISEVYIAKNEVFSVWIDDVIVGFYSFFQQGENLKLDNLFLHPRYIGQGLGRLAMLDFLERVREIPKERIVLEADPHAESFYPRFGFATVSLKATSIPERFMPVMIRSNSDLPNESDFLFNSNRLQVRHLEEEDFEGFYAMQRNPRVMEYVKPAMNYEEAQRELRRFISYYDRRNLFFRIWAVVEKRTESFIGICGVYQNQQGETEIAYRLREFFWGQGYGSEIAKALVHFCFTVLDYDELVGYVRKGNAGSQKILDHLMTLDQEVYSHEANTLEYLYRLRKEDWMWQKGFGS